MGVCVIIYYMDVIAPVRLRNGFSDRNGIQPENRSIQFDSFDDRTRTALINNTSFLMALAFESLPEERRQQLIADMLGQVYLLEIDPSARYGEEDVMPVISRTLREDDYHSVLTLIEYIASRLSSVLDTNGFQTYNYYNRVFENEYVGYRLLRGIIVPITDMDGVRPLESACGVFYSRVSAFLWKMV